jgi:hypothetical protein
MQWHKGRWLIAPGVPGRSPSQRCVCPYRGVGFDGRSQGEAASEEATDTRLQHAQAGLLRTVGGPAGGAAASALGTLYAFGSRATAIGSDLTNQMGVGHMSYHPDLSRHRSRAGGSTANTGDPGHDGPNEQPDQGMPNDPGPAVTAAEPAPPSASRPPNLGGPTNSGGLGGAAGDVGGTSAAAGGGEAEPVDRQGSPCLVARGCSARRSMDVRQQQRWRRSIERQDCQGARRNRFRPVCSLRRTSRLRR